MKALYVIPARGGSKGIPYKNIKLLNGKPLIYYSIDIARQFTSDNHICISTDDDRIIRAVQDYNLNVPFKRPSHLASDNATTNDVLIHAVNFYEKHGIHYEIIVLLQPTSPLRKTSHIREALSLYNDNLDMVVSVKKSHTAAVLCTENNDGFVELCFNKRTLGRQEFVSFYEYNGAVYIINIERLKAKGLKNFTLNKKFIMDDLSSYDIDTPIDWLIIESIIKNNLI